jgi:hypothetical protein
MFVGVDRSLAIFVVLLALWLFGFDLHIARGPMKLLLAVAWVVLAIELLGRWRLAD